MSIRTSDLLNISHESLSKAGCLNSFLDIDAKLYVSPKLLESSSAEFLQGSREAVLNHYRKLIKIIKNIKAKNDIFWLQAHKMLTFKEIPNLALGYSKNGISGKGIGPVLAAKVLKSAIEIVRAGVEDPEIFELMGVFQEGIGADRISDMILRIIYEPFLANYTEFIAKELKIETKNFELENGIYLLPINPQNSEPLILLPIDILAKLPVAVDRSDVSDVCYHNERLRTYVNKKIGSTWHKEIYDISKAKLLKICLEQPQILQETVKRYRDANEYPYDFEKDDQDFFKWFKESNNIAEENPFKKSFKSTSDFSKLVCNHFKELVECNGLSKLFYNENGKLKHERYPQLLFYGISDVYCRQHGITLSRETDAGRGPVDFTFSRNYNEKICVEFKYSKNSSLLKGYNVQLPIYEAAEKSIASIYVVLVVDDKSEKIEQLIAQQKNSSNYSRDIILIDCRQKLSASVAISKD